MSRRIVACAALWAFMLPVAVADAQVANTRHNLMPSGAAGAEARTADSRVCVYCHTPHRAATTRALWNRNLVPVTYTLYTSTTLQATLKQPTGASRLCLSCHDGTTAINSYRVRPTDRPVKPTRLTGRASLRTDLSDDHPVSFVYDAALALKHGELADPALLEDTLPLDSTQQLQCTTCHEPHHSRYRKFLRVDDRGAALCTACHTKRHWNGSSHAISPATWRESGENPWPKSPYTTVSDNGCESCHQSHTAPRPPRLLSSTEEDAVCLVCHNGNVATMNIETELLKPSVHPVGSTNWTHEPREDPYTMPPHVTCTDCHNPHQAESGMGVAPAVPGPLKGVRGVDIAGGVLTEAIHEYEVCLKCHGVWDATIPGMIRQDNTRNVRLEINSSNPSYHPIVTTARNTNPERLEPEYSAASIIYCTDCHNNDEWTASGSHPRGPHGSRYAPILEREYQMNDPWVESFQTYSLCYKCHNRNALLDEQAGAFSHRLHVVEQDAPCAVCHDAHGSRENIALINFMLEDATGKKVVISTTEGTIEFNSAGPGGGECYLVCHGANHDPAVYP